MCNAVILERKMAEYYLNITWKGKIIDIFQKLCTMAKVGINLTFRYKSIKNCIYQNFPANPSKFLSWRLGKNTWKLPPSPTKFFSQRLDKKKKLYPSKFPPNYIKMVFDRRLDKNLYKFVCIKIVTKRSSMFFKTFVNVF